MIFFGTVYRGVRYPTEIAAHLRATKDVIGRTINKLQQARLIERTIDQDDSRRTRLDLTDEGTQTREAVIKRVGSLYRNLVCHIQEQRERTAARFARA